MAKDWAFPASKDHDLGKQFGALKDYELDKKHEKALVAQDWAFPAPKDYGMRKQFGALKARSSFGALLDYELDKQLATGALPTPHDSDLVKPVGALEDYELDRQLGTGAFGIVFQAKHRQTGELVAIKRAPSGSLADSSFNREVRALAALDHPRVVRFVEHFSDTECAYLVEELCSGPDLMSFILERPTTFDGVAYVPEKEAAALFRQCLEAVAGVHAQGFVHRDVKPDNFVFSGPHDKPFLKLVDFGFADKAVGESLKGKGFGTDSWMAPEMLFGEEHTAAVDMWSLGALLFTMLSGEPLVPQDQKDVARRWLQIPTFARRRVRGSEAIKGLGISDEAQDILQRLLEHDPSRRIGAAEALAHPFIAGVCAGREQSE